MGFDANGHFSLSAGDSASPEISGDYSVDGDLIKLQNLVGSPEAIRTFGADNVIQFTRDTSTGTVVFHGHPADLCGTDATRPR